MRENKNAPLKWVSSHCVEVQIRLNHHWTTPQHGLSSLGYHLSCRKLYLAKILSDDNHQRWATGHMLALLLPVKLDFMLNLKSILSHVLKRMPTCWNILIISRNSLWKSFFSTFSYLFVHVIFNVVVSCILDVRKLNYLKFMPGLRLANCQWLPPRFDCLD